MANNSKKDGKETHRTLSSSADFTLQISGFIGKRSVNVRLMSPEEILAFAIAIRNSNPTACATEAERLTHQPRFGQ